VKEMFREEPSASVIGQGDPDRNSFDGVRREKRCCAVGGRSAVLRNRSDIPLTKMSGRKRDVPKDKKGRNGRAQGERRGNKLRTTSSSDGT